LKTLREGIRKEKLCKFYTNEGVCIFAPVSIELSPIYDHNYVVGIDGDHQPQVIRLSETHKISILEDKIKITEEMCELISDHLDKIYEEEFDECSD
jgi:hypothetical protein